MSDQPKPPATDAEIAANWRAVWKVAAKSNCRAGCGALITFIPTKNSSVPVTEDALIHFSDCPKAAEFRKKQ